MMAIVVNLFKKVWDAVLIYARKQTAPVVKSTVEQLMETYAKMGFKWEGELNIFGIRDADSPWSDKFNDAIGIAIGDEIYMWEATTDPGVYWTRGQAKAQWGQPGAAHLRYGQHKNMLAIGTHRGYKALVQVGKVTVWRDANENYIDDDNRDTTGLFGINLHHGNNSKKIGKYSAGCQVVRDTAALNAILNAVESTDKFKKKPGSAFNYTLFDKSQVKFLVR